MDKRTVDTSEYDSFVDDFWVPLTSVPMTLYTCNALCGEVGEIANKIKKYYRDGVVDRRDLALELGDALYYLTALAHQNGYDLLDIANMNMRKLKERFADREVRS